MIGEVGRFQICGAKWKTRATRLAGSHFIPELNVNACPAAAQAASGPCTTESSIRQGSQQQPSQRVSAKFKHEFEVGIIPDDLLIVISPGHQSTGFFDATLPIAAQLNPSKYAVLCIFGFDTEYRYSVPRLTQRPGDGTQSCIPFS